MSNADSIAWTDVARIANLAEAGFLADELNGLCISARIYRLDDFNAALDRWTAKYLIQVPSDQAQRAADHLRQYQFEEEAAERPILDAFRFSREQGLGDLISWRAAVLAAIAGVVGFAYGQQFALRDSPRRMRAHSLPAAVDRIGRPFVTEPIANQPQYRLSLDRANRRWTLATDNDHDGVFEQTEHVPATSSDE